VAAVDVHTLALLFGMMIVTAYLRLSGFFSLVTLWTVRLARSPVSLLAVVVWWRESCRRCS
jgi:Na+/H+ antiporter NhaD/arsenite permease-like protein